MKHFLALVVALVFTEVYADGFEIVLPQSPKSWEAHAAQELKSYLDRRIGEHRLTVGGEVPRFHVGDTDFAAAKGLSGRDLKDEEWVVKSFGRDVIINGGGSHGALYALYHFLEDDCDIRFFSEGDEEIPAASDLSFVQLDRRGRPAFRYRDIYVWGSTDPVHAQFAIKRRLNGYGAIKMPAEVGGFDCYGGIAITHTMDYYLNWKDYGEKHPEYFSLWEGKRCGGMHTGQHCISNPEVWKIFRDAIFREIEQGNARAKEAGIPPPKYYTLMHNDTSIHCQCPACTKLAEKYGWSGAYLLGINKIAEEVDQKYPGTYIDMSAYLFAEPVPKGGVRAAKNVRVVLTDTKGNWAAGWSEPSNDRTRALYDEWPKYCDNMVYYGYTVTFGSYCMGFPFANEFLFAERFRYFAEKKYAGFWIEHEEMDGKADMFDLKFYMLTKLAEDPYADSEKLIVDFLKHYVGPAAKDVYKARLRLAECRKANDGKVIWSPLPTFQFVHSSDQKYIEERFAAARKKVKGVERYERRLEKCWTGFRLLFDQRKLLVKEDNGRYLVRGGCFETGWGSDIDGEKGRTPDDHNPDRELELPNKGPLRVFVADWLGANTIMGNEIKVPATDEFKTFELGVVTFGEENGLWIATGGHKARAIVTPSALVPGKKYRASIEVKATKDAYAVKCVIFTPAK